MKEIKILIQNLRNYPNNYFVIASERGDGLEVIDKDGEPQGTIDLGSIQEVITK